MGRMRMFGFREVGFPKQHKQTSDHGTMLSEGKHLSQELEERFFTPIPSGFRMTVYGVAF